MTVSMGGKLRWVICSLCRPGASSLSLTGVVPMKRPSTITSAKGGAEVTVRMALVGAAFSGTLSAGFPPRNLSGASSPGSGFGLGLGLGLGYVLGVLGTGLL